VILSPSIIKQNQCDGPGLAAIGAAASRLARLLIVNQSNQSHRASKKYRVSPRIKRNLRLLRTFAFTA
jgi:hypothetical protein